MTFCSSKACGMAKLAMCPQLQRRRTLLKNPDGKWAAYTCWVSLPKPHHSSALPVREPAEAAFKLIARLLSRPSLT